MSHPSKDKAAPKIGFASLGCPKALVDSERILTQLRAEGYETVGGFEEADLVVVNTCGFITSAVEESLETIGEAIAENGRVVVTGCLGAEPEKIEAIHPSVLSISGPADYESVIGAVHEHLPPAHDPFLDLLPPQGVKLTPKHYAYVKISEGCNHRCRFCIIPSMRGDLVSRPIDDVMREAERLVAGGVRELLVISQDTSAYGVDVKHTEHEWGGRAWRTHVVDLAEALGELGVWVRLHYVYPYPHVDRLIPLMAEQRILPYLDIPFQHASPAVLARMRRPAHAAKTLERIHAWRAEVPELSIRSTFIVGFPGETDADFELLLEWLDEAQLDRVGCFPYSPVDGAAANDLDGAVPEALRQERWERFMERASAISAARLGAKVGQTMQVLVDGREGDVVVARTPGDAPEIDGIVRIRGDEELGAGDFVDVEITGSDTYDLDARIID